MTREDFERIYLNYVERDYSPTTIESVKRCFVPFEEMNAKCLEVRRIDKIEKEQVIEDIKDFFNCLRRCYVGYDYFHSESEWDRIEAEMIHKIQKHGKKEIKKKEFYNLLVENMKDHILDCHFSISAYLAKVKAFGRTYYVQNTASFGIHKTAYVTDIVLKETKEGYVVVKGNKIFNKNEKLDTISLEGHLFPTLFLEEKNVHAKYYLVGEYSEKPINSIKIQGRQLKTHRIKCDSSLSTSLVNSIVGIFKPRKVVERVQDKGSYLLVTHEHYGMPWNAEQEKIYTKDGVSASEKKYTILNVANNGGGDSFFPEAFYKGLNGIDDVGCFGAYLPFPSEIEGNTKRYQFRKPLCYETEKGNYQGTLFVIMNGATASSAEMAVSCSWYVPNTIWIGSATMGCGTFGKCVNFLLQNSGMHFRCGHRLFYYDGVHEGEGFMPDFWIDDMNPVAVIEEYIKEIS